MARLLPLSLAVLLLATCQRPAVHSARATVVPPAPRPALPDAPATAAAVPGAVPGQLARVRPRPQPCLLHGGETALRIERAAAHYRSGEHARALQCAEEALAQAPRSVPALHYRATALTALGRLEDAKLAFTRALAVDADDPETLHGAADLYVTRLDGGREALLIGLEYALRGARLAVAGKHRDRDLAARLLLLATMAENDLGRSREALAHADAALRDRPRDPNLHYERGLALYELCRFEDARVALERALALAPEDPWTLHYLGLLAEHDGDDGRAAQLLARAQRLSPGEFRGGVTLTDAEFEAELHQAIAALPADERRALASIPLEVAEVPALQDLTAVEPPLSPTILGLYRGPPEQEPCDDEVPCRSIAIYRRNLSRFARDRAELAEQLRVTLLHELGHLHGEDDEQLRARGLE